jgi:hypothetical protein
MSERGGVDNRLEQGGVGIRRLRDEILRRSKDAAGMPVPYFLGEHMNEANAVIDRTLIHRIGTEEAVDVIGP